MFRRGNPFVRAREEASSTCGVSHLRAGLSLSWPSHVHIQPNLLKSCQMTFGKGAVQSLSKKQKLNTRSSTEAELVGADDVATQILWTKHFMEAQGYTIEDNILHQDNKSTILLQENGRKSAGKRSRALNVRYFFLTDQVEKGNLRITYCPTDDMTADYMMKPLQGEKFRKFRAEIMGL